MPRSEIAVIHIDIAGHSKINIPPRDLQKARKYLQKYVSALVNVQKKSEVSWAGDGGWCAIQIDEGTDFVIAVDAAVDILNMMHRINELLIRESIIQDPLNVRICVHTMNVEMDESIDHIYADELNTFLKNERELSIPNNLVISREIYKELKPNFQQSFYEWAFSEKLGSKLYCYKHKTIIEDMLGLDNDLPVKLIFHCIQHTKDVENISVNKITGGLSGLALLIEKIGHLSDNNVPFASPFCTLGGTPDSCEDWINRFGHESNLILLDSPHYFDGDGNKHVLNWASDHVISAWKKNSNLSISLTPPNKDERKKSKENNVVTISDGSNIKRFIATTTFDFGFVIRMKNPFCEDGIILILAGIHSTATHAANEIITNPEKIVELLNLLQHPKNCPIPYFEAVFTTPRDCTDPNVLKWKTANVLT